MPGFGGFCLDFWNATSQLSNRNPARVNASAPPTPRRFLASSFAFSASFRQQFGDSKLFLTHCLYAFPLFGQDHRPVQFAGE